jgi:hypothetical protein
VVESYRSLGIRVTRSQVELAAVEYIGWYNAARLHEPRLPAAGRVRAALAHRESPESARPITRVARRQRKPSQRLLCSPAAARTPHMATITTDRRSSRWCPTPRAPPRQARSRHRRHNRLQSAKEEWKPTKPVPVETGPAHIYLAIAKRREEVAPDLQLDVGASRLQDPLRRPTTLTRLHR